MIRDFNPSFSRRVGYRWKQVVDVATHHHRDDLGIGDFIDSARADMFTVTKHAVGIGDFTHLFQEMADVHDTDSTAVSNDE